VHQVYHWTDSIGLLEVKYHSNLGASIFQQHLLQFSLSFIKMASDTLLDFLSLLLLPVMLIGTWKSFVNYKCGKTIRRMECQGNNWISDTHYSNSLV